MDVDYDRLEDGPSREVTGNVISSVKFGRGLYFCASFMKEVPTAVILLLFYGRSDQPGAVVAVRGDHADRGSSI